jgi:hypothetical protein
MMAVIVFFLIWFLFIGILFWLLNKMEKMNDTLAAHVKQLQSLHDYLEQPDVLMSIPQPHRLRISELLHGENQRSD